MLLSPSQATALCSSDFRGHASPHRDCSCSPSEHTPDSLWQIPGRPHSLGVQWVVKRTAAAIHLTLKVCLPQSPQGHPERGTRQAIQRFVQTLALPSVVRTIACLPIHSLGPTDGGQWSTPYLLKSHKATHIFPLENFVKVIIARK